MPSAMSPKLLFLLLLALFSPAFAAEPPGSWLPPDPDGRPWKHAETGLSFPVILGTHRLAGEFRYREGGGRFIRYESLEERSRGDIFFFPAGTKDITMEEKQRLILQEMDNVLKDLEAMSKEGRYKEFFDLDIPASRAANAARFVDRADQYLAFDDGRIAPAFRDDRHHPQRRWRDRRLVLSSWAISKGARWPLCHLCRNRRRVTDAAHCAEGQRA